MELILHFSVHCANISFFFETTKFLEEFFQLNVFHQYYVSTISQVDTLLGLTLPYHPLQIPI